MKKKGREPNYRIDVIEYLLKKYTRAVRLENLVVLENKEGIFTSCIDSFSRNEKFHKDIKDAKLGEVIELNKYRGE